jgi:O-antigen ligase/tetratricopeptide (TPR) repeat protein
MSIISLKNIPYFIFLFLLIFAPLAFGTEELWSLAIMEALCYTAALFYFISPQNRAAIYQVPGILPLILLLCYMLLQMIPLPSLLVGAISPETLKLYQGTIGIVEMPAWLTLSVNPRSTLEEFFRISAYVAFYVLGIQLLTDSTRLKKTVFIVLCLCSLIAFQSILQRYLDNGRIYWLWTAPPNSSFTGPYVYHNHFAGFMEMLVPVAIALFLRYRPQIHYGDSWRQRLANVMANLQFNTHLLLGFAAVLMALSIFVSMSRGGMISFGLSCFILFLVLSRRAKKNSSIKLGLLLFVVIFLVVGWFGWDVIDQRFGVMFDQQGRFRELRPRIWRESIGIIKDFPVTGTGWGTFENVFPTYKTFMTKHFDYYAHNDYIETLTSGGIISLVLIGWFLGNVFLQIRKTLARRRDSYAVYLTWGSLAAILAIFIHSSLDFILQNGANGLYFFFLLSLAVSASHTRLHGNKATILIPQKKSGLRYAALLCLIFLLFTSSVVNSGSLRGNGQLAAIIPFSWNAETPKEEMQEIVNRLDSALSFSPLNSYIHFLLADAQKTIGNVEVANRYYRKAIRLNPAQANYLQGYGLFLDENGERSLADTLLRAGIHHDRSNPDRKREYANFLFTSNDNEKGLQVMASVLAQDPNGAIKDIAFIVEAGISDNDIRRNLPTRVVPHLAFAAHLEQKGDQEQAAALYRQSLTYIDNEKNLRPDYFYRVSRFFSKHKRYEEGLDVILQALEFFPTNAGLRVRAGNLYRDIGLNHRAVEQYQQALAIDQENIQARKNLAKLQQDVDKKIKL